MGSGGFGIENDLTGDTACLGVAQRGGGIGERERRATSAVIAPRGEESQHGAEVVTQLGSMQAG